MTFEQAVDAYGRFLNAQGRDENAESNILEFLNWEEANEDEFAQDVRITLASADFSKELTTAVMWLNERQLDIRCVRLKPYRDGQRILLDVQQVIPLPEAEDYLIQVKQKVERERIERLEREYFLKSLQRRRHVYECQRTDTRGGCIS